MENNNFFFLIIEATQMLQDRSRPEADLIYAIASLGDEERTAIRLAYKELFGEEKE